MFPGAPEPRVQRRQLPRYPISTGAARGQDVALLTRILHFTNGRKTHSFHFVSFGEILRLGMIKCPP